MKHIHIFEMTEATSIPRDVLQLIPTYSGETNVLNLFLRKCEYVISKYQGTPERNEFLMQSITSKLTGNAASLISERADFQSYDELKALLTQHFGDPRSEECLAIELETLKIKPGESYLQLCGRIQEVRSILLAKVNQLTDENLISAKTIIYNNTSMNVFLYNLPEDLLRIVRLKGCTSLENALSIVLEEVNFLYQYNARNKMMKAPYNAPQPPKPQPIQLTSQVQPLPQTFKFGIPQNNNNSKPNFQQQHPQSQPRFKFGITPSNQFRSTHQPQQFGFKPQMQQQPLGYRPQLGATPQFGYKPNFTQQQFGYRPPQNLQPQQFGYKPNFQKVPYTDVSMRTAPPAKPQGFRMNELYNINECESDECNTMYDPNPNNVECYDYERADQDTGYNDDSGEAQSNEQNTNVENIENFQIMASTINRK